MEKFRLVIKPKAESDFLKIIKSGDRASIKKLELILVELSEHPEIGTGNPEQLKHQLSGYWSTKKIGLSMRS